LGERISTMLLLYLPEEKEAEKRLLKVARHAVPRQKIEICRSFQMLEERLRQPVFNISAVVLFVPTSEDLEGVLLFKESFWDLRIIIILPDAEQDTIKKAHSLRPRFVTWADDDFTGVGIILKRMTERHDRTLYAETEN